MCCSEGSIKNYKDFSVAPVDPLSMENQANVVYEVPCNCGQVYIGETIICQFKTHLKEHKNACIKGFTDKSDIAEHA